MGACLSTGAVVGGSGRSMQQQRARARQLEREKAEKARRSRDAAAGLTLPKDIKLTDGSSSSSSTTSSSEMPLTPLQDLLKDYDKRVSLSKLMQSPDAAPANSVEESPSKDADVLLLQKQARMKAAKLRAEQEKRWLLFSNLDTVSEADMMLVAKFMQTVCLKVPELAQFINQEESFNELNKVGKDEGTIQLNRKNSQNIDLARGNSQSFITALKQIRESQDNVKRKNSVGDTIELGDRRSSRSYIELERKNSRGSFVELERKNSFGNLSRDTSRDSMNHVFSFDQIAMSGDLQNKITLECVIPDEKLAGYDIPTGNITPYTVDLIIALYKKMGKLTMASVHSILRQSYKKIKELGNTNRISLGDNDKITVVGDIHGQFADLLYIIEESGLPKANNNKYVFNGDFVDRGTEGVEVTCLLLALFCAFPGHVCLNRGNHEDFAVCCAYGFQAECRSKYDNVTFGMFVEIFQNLPLFTIIDDAVLVVHGGLFHCPDTTLKDLDNIPRHDFLLSDVHMDGVCIDAIPRYERREFTRQLQRDALWSDPNPSVGLHLNPRGAGVGFGPDVTKSFLERNKLSMVVRSHECVRTGFERPYTEPENVDLLCTVFSASNYYGAGNTAAYLVFSKSMLAGEGSKEQFHVSNTNIKYFVYYFLTDAGDDEEDVKTVCGGSGSGYNNNNSLGRTLYDLILKNKAQLLAEFRSKDNNNSGRVSKQQWTEAMQSVCKLQLQWASMFSVLASPDCQEWNNNNNNSSSGSVANSNESVLVIYERFLDDFTPTPDPVNNNNNNNKHGDTTEEHKYSDSDNNNNNNSDIFLVNATVAGVAAGNPDDNNNNNSNMSVSERKIAQINAMNAAAIVEDELFAPSSHSLSIAAAADAVDAGTHINNNNKADSNNNNSNSHELHANSVTATGEEDLDGGDVDDLSLSSAVVESLYAHHRLLETVFRFFDKSGQGTISKQEFVDGCALLNQSLDEENRIQEVERVVAAMDVSGRGEIDINEFFEMFRLSDERINISRLLDQSKPMVVSDPVGFNNSQMLQMV